MNMGFFYIVLERITVPAKNTSFTISCTDSY